MSGVRVRFAPSPTGTLHVGGARTALFNYLFAKKHGGIFVLRIEDTDRERSREEHVRGILDGLTWLGLAWDEGPVYQAEGLERHTANAQALLEAGTAYRCFCTPDELDGMRREAESRKVPFRYDRRCLHLSTEESAARAADGVPFCVRFRVPDGEARFKDLVHGDKVFRGTEIEDFVLLRSDGTPTYHLSVVSDDIALNITHVIRGDDHLSNTPKQIFLYKALATQPPEFAHLPLILGTDKKRLSKRHGATSVLAYRDQGILPDAMLNFLALLGWSPGGDRELMSLGELIESFSFEAVSRSGAVFDHEKLSWMAAKHLSRTSADALIALLADRLPAGLPAARLTALVDLAKTRAQSLHGLAEDVARYVDGDVRYDARAVKKHLKGDDLEARLDALAEALAGCAEWNLESLEAALRSAAEALGVAAGKLIHPARVALLGVSVSPGIFDVLQAVGRDESLRRIRALAAAVRKGTLERLDAATEAADS